VSAVVVPLLQRAAAESGIVDRGEYLGRLHEILAALEADDQVLFESRLNQLMRLREEGLFVNLAKLTRELHQAVRELNFDERLQQLAGNDIPDARARLDYVVKLGEDAAHRTLDHVDDARKALDTLGGCASRIAEVQAKLAGSESLAQAQAPALHESVETMKQVAGEVRSHLSAISQAQEYQDLSGQVIRRVITLVHNIEGALIKLLKATNDGLKPTPSAPITTAPGELAGPAVPGLETGAQSQQDADALLAELGF
jgi:chemotaxis protein CheZ